MSGGCIGLKSKWIKPEADHFVQVVQSIRCECDAISIYPHPPVKWVHSSARIWIN